MSDYRDELIEKAKSGMPKVEDASSQIDVTSSGNYAAAWMEQDKKLGTTRDRLIQEQADANLAMAEVWRETDSRFEWTGLEATTELGDFSPSSPESAHGGKVPFDYDSTSIPVAVKDDDGSVSIQDMEYTKSDLDSRLDEYIAQGGSQEVVDKAKQTQAYQAVDAGNDYEEALAAHQAKQAPVAKTEPLSELQQSVDNANSEDTSRQAPAPTETTVEPQQLEVPPSQDMPVSGEPAAPAAEPPPLTKTQEEAKSRGDALRARQERSQPQQAAFPDLRGTEQKPEQQTDEEPLNRTQEKAKSRGDALRARQARMQGGVEEMLETGENLPNRQPNYRADSTSYNASVHDFGVTVADNFETTANTLSIISARLRRIEQIIAEAGR